ncbi:TPA: hypothetical protein DCZ46_04005 [Candidatus Campbellbacteria bacterium]|jgi:hypothetical protein|nr:MAG: hypothetical protein UR58_C0001G0481 [Candidatus Campbellbacteria bacterium GW2011_OD1_34_28]KKP74999.1 MAG: hypothetical protein UR74_C0002G0265 [Candidatus Campbellbacteria bacterium GW2011_GWD2_35_24]KKP75885.1 MAG: hypothetical protein UR75_C0002G0266 [Candidatus Campbellbacteria bacterium GW2011_GWC2_35_28]KKP76867.1 MAG: hypothetical protein UR76_C0002G0068 [Candidatus Campbellbacteria bacterium GW2011_GWC1_35_31]KKP78793.1 MAG: hypothetical protein UR79_C0002G0068 [Candidatus Cam
MGAGENCGFTPMDEGSEDESPRKKPLGIPLTPDIKRFREEIIEPWKKAGRDAGEEGKYPC